MTCEPFDLEGGGRGIVCARSLRTRLVYCECGNVADYECDYPRGNSTCNRRLCETCATSVGDDRDYCPEHADQQTLGIG